MYPAILAELCFVELYRNAFQQVLLVEGWGLLATQHLYHGFLPASSWPTPLKDELTVHPTITSLHTANNSKFTFKAVIDKATRKELHKLATEPPCKPSIRASHGVLNDGPQGLLSKFQQHHTLLPYKQLYSRTWCCIPLFSKPLDQLPWKIIHLKA